MGKITKTMQAKHLHTQSPWLKKFVQDASSITLPLLPSYLDKFPSRWPFPRGDLYHWIPLLNRFDDILELFCSTYKLADGPQLRAFGREILLKKVPVPNDHDDKVWSAETLSELGYREDGDRELIEAVLKFSRLLLEHCGNRSIYASSMHLDSLLQTTCDTVLLATLQVTLELAKRYQASIKKLPTPSRQVSNALLANHYNIDVDRVQQIATAFVKTPIISLSDSVSVGSPASAKGKERASTGGHKNVASMYANDLVAVATADDAQWRGWGDVRVAYYPSAPPDSEVKHSSTDRILGAPPSTPTPLRRSTTVGQQHTPRTGRQSGDDSSPPSAKSLGGFRDESNTSDQKTLNTPQGALAYISAYDLLSRCPADLPKASKYEYLNRLRVAKALLGSLESRRTALAIRLLAISNLAYIYPESTFVEKVLRHDHDETRRFQLVYQLADLIRPSPDGSSPIPLPLQTIAIRLLEAIAAFPLRYTDVLSALNANVSHGVLLYVIRKAVSGLKEEDGEDDGPHSTTFDDWYQSLFALALHMAMSSPSRTGSEMTSSGLIDIYVEILGIRSKRAQRAYANVLSNLDTLVWHVQSAFQTFFGANGLDAIAELLISTVDESYTLVDSGQAMPQECRSLQVDYQIPFYQQQTLKWLLKFLHNVLSNSYSYGTNIERLMNNLVDNGHMLQCLQKIIERSRIGGAVVWTNAVTVVSDFINNEPTSFTALNDSGVIRGFLKTMTGRQDPVQQHPESTPSNAETGAGDPPESGPSIVFQDDRPHPPPEEVLSEPRNGNLAQGILPSNEAINCVPQFLNSISLNPEGMKLVVSSGAFESFYEIFENPAHVQILTSDSNLPVNVGNSFDELSRHHPHLRESINNATIDMVARLVYLGRAKAKTSGWGTKLVLDDFQGKAITADDRFLERMSEQPTSTRKGKGRATDQDADVEMANATHGDSNSDSPTIGSPGSRTESSENSFTPYLYALAQFLTAYISNSNLKKLFIDRGGIELLFDLCESPSLTYDFGDSSASRTLQHVISQLVEQAPVLGLPSLLNRTQATLDILRPLAEKMEYHPPYFAPFLVSELRLTYEDVTNWDSEMTQKIASGTKMVKALLNAQSLLKTLSQCFHPSQRGSAVQFFAINVFDQYTRVVETLGPLLRGALAEESSEEAVVPVHWSRRNRASDQALLGPGGAPNPEKDDGLPLDAVTGNSSSASTGQSTSESENKRPTQQEQGSARYQNFETLHFLLHSLMPTTFPFFQTLGKALLPRRERDVYARPHHLQIAKTLAQSVLAQLEPSLAISEPTRKDYHFWIIMLHTMAEMLVDSTRHRDRDGVSIIIPVLLAFHAQNGVGVLNSMLRIWCEDVRKDNRNDAEKINAKVALFGLGKILDLYAILVHGKAISESASQYGLSPRSQDRRSDSSIPSQLTIEMRSAILPEIRKIWESDLIEKASDEILSKAIGVLKFIAQGDHEGHRADKTSLDQLFMNLEPSFNWEIHSDGIAELTKQFDDKELALEAIFRAGGSSPYAVEYGRAHKAGLAGARNPVPSQEAYKPSTAEPEKSASQGESSSAAAPPAPEADAMSIDHPASPVVPASDLDELLEDAVLDDIEHSDHDSDDNSSIASNPPPANEVSSGNEGESSDKAAEGRPAATKEDLDAERNALREGAIDRCLDVIRAHPACSVEISEFIRDLVLRQSSDELKEDVGATLVNAISSLKTDDDGDINAESVTSYTHLLALLLQDDKFLSCNLGTLSEKVDEYLAFLKLAQPGASEDLPPWLPDTLLVLEILLKDEELPPDVPWKPPANENEPFPQFMLPSKTPVVKGEQRVELFDFILDVLPRIGKDKTLAICALRILVLLTRERSFAHRIGDKANLHRLFVMVKQLAGTGSSPVKDPRVTSAVMNILRHIVEDDEMIKQIMRSEIKAVFDNPQRSHRHLDLQGYLRALSATALRAPELFVEVTNEMVKVARYPLPLTDGPSRSYSLLLKDTSDAAKSSLIEPTGTAKQDAKATSPENVKPTTEEDGKGAAEETKASHDLKRPILENPDGVVHFLLTQLLNYKEVDDKEPVANSKDPTATEPSAEAPTSSISEGDDAAEKKDKKSSKPVFKADEHPIFIYRCFLLFCLSELLQSYTRTKVEFINFKRKMPAVNNTPVKPRSSVLNYLINDLLCQGHLAGEADTIPEKKKTATAGYAQQVLVALVVKTSEKSVDYRNRVNYEYDDEPDLLFVRSFVLDTILRAYEKAASPEEPLEARYAKMQSLAELLNEMIGDRDRELGATTRATEQSPLTHSQAQLRRMMYEKGFLDRLTSSIAEVDLSYPNVKRALRYILKVLGSLTNTAKELSQSNDISLSVLPTENDEDFASSSSLSDLEDDREQTPDLYRNSSLGMLEPGVDDDDSDEDEDDDEEMYDDEYGDEMDYGDEDDSGDGEEDVSDEDEELGEMGAIEGLHGEAGVVEVIMGEDDDDEDDDEDSDDEVGSEDIIDVDDHLEVFDVEGNHIDDDANSDWESESDNDGDDAGEDDEDDEEDDDGGDGDNDEVDAEDDHPALIELGSHSASVLRLTRAVLEGSQDFDAFIEGPGYIDDVREEDEDEDEEEEVEDDEYIYDEDDFPRNEPTVIPPAGLGWDTVILEHNPHGMGHGGHAHRHHNHGNRSPFPPGFLVSGHRDAIGGMFDIRNNPMGADDEEEGDGVIQLHVGGIDLNALRRHIRRMDGEIAADQAPDLHSYFTHRSHRTGGLPGHADDGVNPLLRRTGESAPESSPRPRRNSMGLAHPPHGMGRSVFENPAAILNELINAVPIRSTNNPMVHALLRDASHGEFRGFSHALFHGRELFRTDSRRDVQEPQHAVVFPSASTLDRYQEEARVVFGAHYGDRANRLSGRILAGLVPPAMEIEKKRKAVEEERRKQQEEERKKREEEERRAKEAQAAEKAEREKKEAEERELAERGAAEAAEAAAAAAQAAEAEAAEAETTESAPIEVEEAPVEEEDEAEDEAEDEPMEGVETEESLPASAPAAESSDNQARVLTTIRGETVDVTELGIDPEYLEALPEEFREEVIAQTLTARRSQARNEGQTQPGGETNEFLQEFLDALPDEIRLEIIQQERQETRRREREEQRRQQAASGQQEAAVDMDPASILLTFPPELRQQVLLDQGEELMDQLPPDMAAQARALAQRNPIPPVLSSGTHVARRTIPPISDERIDGTKTQRRTVVQMLDKAGIATLLRLMFIAHPMNIRKYLFAIFSDVCENRQNRVEVVSSVLQILQDGSTDMDAVERSFSQLSLKAKKPKEKDQDQKTPQNLKRTLTTLSLPGPSQSNSEISPLLVVQQCLDLLVNLANKNLHIPSLFLTEHDTVGTSLRRSTSRKGKGKETKAHKYAINSLLGLLDRDLIMESSDVMITLADLLWRVTQPLQNLERRRRELEEEEEQKKKAAAAEEAEAAKTHGAAEIAEGSGTTETTAETPAAATSDQPVAETRTAVDMAETGQDSKTEVKSEAAAKKARQLQPPVIPPQTLRLVIKIFVARECHSKTFQNAISTIKNLSCIPGAKAVFGQELVRQARILSENIVKDLNELMPHVLKATSGTEVQGVALAKFSPGASEQNKLLRVLTTLDHLFETKKKTDGKDETANAAADSEKQDLVMSLYHNSTFSTMWEKLSECLGAIRQQENMLHVATILLPLIESLMVVCKNSTDSDVPASQSQIGKDMLLSSPPPESRMAGLFFTFTEEHRRILNELVRNNPKLMSGTFSLLVKNPKVLEFDNKRNYFNRSVHARTSNAQSRPNYQALQLAVRRDHIFHDSFKALYFKSGDEMKFGKLNIRFHNEEGVDAGGVTREWFQVLARQMFNPNYALFIPVSSDRTTFHPNKLSSINDEHLMFFKFIGRIIGKALYEGRVLDCYFSRAVYKRILGKSVSVKDMESFDPDYYKSLVWMLDNDITDIITETFSVEDDEFGAKTIVDLCPNGREILVTEDNKHEYVRLVVEHKLLSSVKDQMEHFLKGFHDIIPSDLISIFNEQELELLISGLPDIDVDDWKSNTEYQNYTMSSPQIQWFWRAVRSFDKEERAKLLQFVTGTSKVPLNGFKELEGMNGVNRFNVHRDYGAKDRLPSSHTCFNQLDLPEYESYDFLRAQILKAISAGNDYFGFA